MGGYLVGHSKVSRRIRLVSFKPVVQITFMKIHQKEVISLANLQCRSKQHLISVASRLSGPAGQSLVGLRQSLGWLIEELQSEITRVNARSWGQGNQKYIPLNLQDLTSIAWRLGVLT